MTHFNYRILVVDDDENLRQIAKFVLQAEGYEVQLAFDGFDGLGKLKKALPDVIISDLEMPNMNGFEFLSVVRRRFPQIAVIAISGAFARGVEMPSNVLADAFFEKGNYAPPELFVKIVALLEEMPVRSQVVRKVEPALWFPIEGNRSYIAVTCPYCLRTFPLGTATLIGDSTVCDFCDSAVTLHIPILKDGSAVDLCAIASEDEDKPAA